MSVAAIGQSLRWLRDPYRVLDERLARSEIAFRMHLIGMGRVLVTGEPADIEDAVRNDSLIGGRGTRALRPIVGDGAMIVREGAPHRAHRALVAPFFSSAAAASYDATVIEETERRLAALARGARFSAMEVFDDINLAVIVRIAFGELPRESCVRLVRSVRRYRESLGSPAVLFLRPLHIPLGRFTAWGRHQRARAELRTALDAAMPAAAPNTLAVAVRERVEEGQWTADEGRDALGEILLFGHDTAAATLAWWAGHLHAHPQALERARAPDGGAYLRATLEESMRLAPVVPHLTRVATRATQVGSHGVEAGEHVFLCTYLAHRDPRRFPDPAAYQPQRFLEAPPAGFSYFPFGLGSRLCAGFSFAMRQMELMAARFMAAGPFRLAAGVPRAERRLVLMVPEGGAQMERV